MFAQIALLLHIKPVVYAESCDAPVKNLSENNAGIRMKLLQVIKDLRFELQT